MSSQFPQRLLVSYITTVALPGLVILSNFCMLGLVVFKLWEVKKGRGSGSSSCKNLSKGKGTRLWKDCATVLGLSCVLGIPWGLASTTYISLPGIYTFTVLNCLQGQYGIFFLWSIQYIFSLAWPMTVFLFSCFFPPRCFHFPVVPGPTPQSSIWE